MSGVTDPLGHPHHSGHRPTALCGGHSEVPLRTIPALLFAACTTAPPAASDGLTWLEGTWQQRQEQVRTEERWVVQRDGSLLGAGRVMIDDRLGFSETLSIHRGLENNPEELVAQVRVALGPSIFQSVVGGAQELPVMVLDPQLEQMMSSAVQNNQGVIEPNLLDTMVKGIGEAAEKMEAEGASPVLLVSGIIRGFLSKLLRGRMSNFYICLLYTSPSPRD